jgi:hypothetical protein
MRRRVLPPVHAAPCVRGVDGVGPWWEAKGQGQHVFPHPQQPGWSRAWNSGYSSLHFWSEGERGWVTMFMQVACRDARSAPRCCVCAWSYLNEHHARTTRH